MPLFAPFIVGHKVWGSFKLGWDIQETIEARKDFDLLSEEIARVRAEIAACPPNDPRFPELYEELAQLQAGISRRQ